LKVKLPALSLIISGGNTLFVLVKDVGTYEVLGRTLDDAAGECLDKIGRMLNLGYPAGPVMEEFARLGNKDAYPFPLPLTTVKTYDVSFSGMKTFARNLLDTLTAERPLNRQEMYDFCASAQQGVFRHICYKLTKILEDLYAQAYTKNYANVAFSSQQNKDFAVQGVWLGGGVAANMTLRKMLRDTLRNFTQKNSLTSLRLRTPYTKRLCADNAAMIGVVAGVTEKIRFTVENLAFVERAPRLPLDGN
jgi:N6-L-threonylcarbamoyladenine synthase